MTEHTTNGATSLRVYTPVVQPQSPVAEPAIIEQTTHDSAHRDGFGEDSAHKTVTATAPVSVRRPHKPWALIIIGLAAAVVVWSGWVGLGQMAGFGDVHPLPGIVDDFKVNTALVLPLSVEAYAAYALRVWLGSSATSTRTQRFAKFSALASLGIGAVAQIAYHLMEAAGATHAPWPIVMLVAIIPVIVLGLASALAKLVTSDTNEEN